MKKTLIFSIIALVLVLGLVFFLTRPSEPKSDKQSNLIPLTKEITPSETFTSYEDPAGFSFSYPDNLSIQKSEIEDPDSYADLQLFSKDVNGSIKLKIADSQFKTLDEWLEANNIPSSNTPIQKKLGNLNALEVKTTDRLMLGALDQKVLFTIEAPLVEEKFWGKVYDQLLAGFTFVSPEANTAGGASTESDVTFEGEEVIE